MSGCQLKDTRGDKNTSVSLCKRKRKLTTVCSLICTYWWFNHIFFIVIHPYCFIDSVNKMGIQRAAIDLTNCWVQRYLETFFNTYENLQFAIIVCAVAENHFSTLIMEICKYSNHPVSVSYITGGSKFTSNLYKLHVVVVVVSAPPQSTIRFIWQRFNTGYLTVFYKQQNAPDQQNPAQIKGQQKQIKKLN